jgi:hypothetical protein
MNTKSVRSAILGISAIIVVISLSGCASKHTFLSSSVVPAARGTGKMKKDGNDNYQIKIDINNLSEVKRLQPAKGAYVVWMEGDEEAIKNIGQINSGSTMISSKLKASFHTVSSTKPHRIFVTAEDNSSVTVPGSTIVLTTDKF